MCSFTVSLNWLPGTPGRLRASRNGGLCLQAVVGFQADVRNRRERKQRKAGWAGTRPSGEGPSWETMPTEGDAIQQD